MSEPDILPSCTLTEHRACGRPSVFVAQIRTKAGAQTIEKRWEDLERLESDLASVGTLPALPARRSVVAALSPCFRDTRRVQVEHFVSGILQLPQEVADENAEVAELHGRNLEPVATVGRDLGSIPQLDQEEPHHAEKKTQEKEGFLARAKHGMAHMLHLDGEEQEVVGHTKKEEEEEAVVGIVFESPECKDKFLTELSKQESVQFSNDAKGHWKTKQKSVVACGSAFGVCFRFVHGCCSDMGSYVQGVRMHHMMNVLSQNQDTQDTLQSVYSQHIEDVKNCGPRPTPEKQANAAAIAPVTDNAVEAEIESNELAAATASSADKAAEPQIQSRQLAAASAPPADKAAAPEAAPQAAATTVAADKDCRAPSRVGKPVMVRSRTGKIIIEDDSELPYKVVFDDGQFPKADWVKHEDTEVLHFAQETASAFDPAKLVSLREKACTALTESSANGRLVEVLESVRGPVAAPVAEAASAAAHSMVDVAFSSVEDAVGGAFTSAAHAVGGALTSAEHAVEGAFHKVGDFFHHRDKEQPQADARACTPPAPMLGTTPYRRLPSVGTWLVEYNLPELPEASAAQKSPAEENAPNSDSFRLLYDVAKNKIGELEEKIGLVGA
mmetsp:Transcript_109712/g.211006  ORF Transcript_109712/g.211006 Transcript_109712/m.211006 type:complete len:613 (-) Transcript_109712:132-1970(-)